MKDFILDVWQDLREKRLWPVAVALALALVAVPVVLLKGTPDDTGPRGTMAGTGARLPIIASDPTGLAGSSKLDSFGSKDPFRSRAENPKVVDPGLAGLPGGTAPALGSEVAGIDSGGSLGVGGPSDAGIPSDLGGSGGTGGGPPSGASAGSSGNGAARRGSGGESGGSGGGGSQPARSEPPKPRYYTYQAHVEFGLRGAEREFKDLEAVAPLVGRNGDVVVVYLGQSPEGESVFLVNQSFEVTKGRSNCRSECAFVYLLPEKGRSEVILRGEDGAEYRLNLRGVRRVLDDRDGSVKSSSTRAERADKANAPARSKRAQRKTYFDFRIPLVAGRRR